MSDAVYVPSRLSELGGMVATAQLGTGSASSSTYLRGDQTWATIPAGGSPGGADGSVQFKSGSAFGGFGSWDGDTLLLDAGDRVAFGSAAQQFLRAGAFPLMHSSYNLTNFFAGVNAGNPSTTGICNTSVGTSALAGNTTGSNNTVGGTDAGKNGAVLNSCTLWGANCAPNIGTAGGTASNVVAIGHSALVNATTAIYVLAVGDCLGLATSLSYCQVAGAACAANVTAPINTQAFGTAVFQSATTLNSVAGFGTNTFKDAASVTQSVGYGTDAGGGITSTANGDTFLGHGAGGPGLIPASLTGAGGVGRFADPQADYVMAIGGSGSHSVVMKLADRAFPADLTLRNGESYIRVNLTAGASKFMVRGRDSAGNMVAGEFNLS